MKKLFCLSLAALTLLSVSCNKDDKPGKGKYGVDGVTPLPEAVDLGTVVNGKTIKWASFNLGASKEYEYGDYYAWGETATKSDYSWATYTYANGSYNKLTKYCPKDKTDYWDVAGKEPDGEVTLLPSDDVAHVKLGGKWRMPTLDEINALLSLRTNDDYTWEKWALPTDENGNEIKDNWGNVVRGLRITRKSTGATLFLPASGYCGGASIGKNAGSWGYFWSSSLLTDHPNSVCNMYFYSDDSDHNSYARFYGFPVRPVSE